MSYQTPAQLQRRSQVQEARTRLVDLLHRTVGPAMTAEEAQSLLQKAQAWSPLGPGSWTAMSATPRTH